MVAGRAQGVLRVQGTPVALEEELEFRAQVCRPWGTRLRTVEDLRSHILPYDLAVGVLQRVQENLASWPFPFRYESPRNATLGQR